MSVFENQQIDEVLYKIEQDNSLLSKFDIQDWFDRNLLKQIISIKPEYYLLLDESVLFEEITIGFVSKFPLFFDKIPKSARTSQAKLTALRKMPSVVGTFDKEDFDFETVKYLYVNYPILLNDFDKEIQSVVNKHVEACKKQNIKIEFENIDFESEEEEA